MASENSMHCAALVPGSSFSKLLLSPRAAFFLSMPCLELLDYQWAIIAINTFVLSFLAVLIFSYFCVTALSVPLTLSKYCPALWEEEKY